MKRIFVMIASAFLIQACGGNSAKNNDAKDDITSDPVYQKGVALVGKNKCLTCHAINETITGPPYAEIGKKYLNMPDTIVGHLARKIITGGNGVWGQIYMTPHPDLSKEDAEAMVRYILLLGKKAK
jgi:cytochrome c